MDGALLHLTQGWSHKNRLKQLQLLLFILVITTRVGVHRVRAGDVNVPGMYGEGHSVDQTSSHAPR